MALTRQTFSIEPRREVMIPVEPRSSFYENLSRWFTGGTEEQIIAKDSSAAPAEFIIKVGPKAKFDGNQTKFVEHLNEPLEAGLGDFRLESEVIDLKAFVGQIFDTILRLDVGKIKAFLFQLGEFLSFILTFFL